MPPKSQRQNPGKGRANEDNKADLLQAVVVADTFETRFTPFSLERPRCLLPLANTPLIEYTLEFLASAGVQEVYLYAGAHVDQVETYINASRWSSTCSPFKKLVFIRCVATSVGDVMRDLDQKHILAGDFIVVSGDVLCNFPISRALKSHKARREKDKNAIMTMLLREADPDYYSLSNSTVPTFVIDPSKDRCLHYEEGSTTATINTHVDPEMLKTPEIDVRQDLVDCRIDICTPDVLSLWSDNFDNQAPRKDFLFGVLKDYELNGKTIHIYILEDHYAARAADLWAYGKISRDLLNGSASTLSAEHNVFSNSHFKRRRGGPVCDSSVMKARPVNIDSKTIIGAGTSIGAKSQLRRSIVGHRCHIGKGTKIDSSYIWDDATIGSNVTITQAIVGGESFIGDNCTVEQDALISFGVKIAAGTKVSAGSRMTTTAHTNGDGNIYDDEEEDGKNNTGLVYQQKAFTDSASTLASEMSEPSSPIDGSRSQSFATSVSDDDGSDRFQHDTVAILVQRMQEGKKADDMLSELMGLRFSGGADETQVRKAVATAMSKRISGQAEEGQPPADAARRTLQAYRTLIRRDHAQQTTREQVDFLIDLQRDLTRRHEGSKVLLFVAKDLYDLEVIGEDSFISWWSDERSTADDEMQEVRKQTAQFMEWLQNAESESEEEDEDDEEDDE